MMDPTNALQYEALWREFTVAMLCLSVLWAICGAVLLFYREYINKMALLLLGASLVFLVAHPISPASWGLLVTGFVFHAYSRISLRIRRPMAQAVGQTENRRETSVHDRCP